MSVGILLASPIIRERMRRERLRRRLDRFANLPLSSSDRGYLDLAELLLLNEQPQSLQPGSKQEA
jgi:hypothetical protein